MFYILSLLSIYLFLKFFHRVKITRHMLDHEKTSLKKLTEKSLISSKNISKKDNKIVYIAVHGYTASTFEFKELKEFLEHDKDILISSILLGGHGESYSVFKNTKWQEWADPILNEYKRLIELGYKNINFIGSSTGASLILILLLEKKIKSEFTNHIIGIDTLFTPKNKFLYLVPYLKPLLIDHVHKKSDTKIEQENWYQIRSYKSLTELVKCISHLKDCINKYKFNKNITIDLFQSKHDPVVDAKGILYLENKSLKNVTIEMVNSNQHVPIRQSGRKKKNKILQESMFSKIAERIKLYKS